jgi:hypothetical protein
MEEASEYLMAGFVTTIKTYPCNVLLEILKYQSTVIFNYITLFGFYFERDLMVKPKQHNVNGDKMAERFTKEMRQRLSCQSG